MPSSFIPHPSTFLLSCAEAQSCASAAVGTAIEELQLLEGSLPVATPDDLDHAAMTLTLATAMLKRVAQRKRQAARATIPVNRWWE